MGDISQKRDMGKHWKNRVCFSVCIVLSIQIVLGQDEFEAPAIQNLQLLECSDTTASLTWDPPVAWSPYDWLSPEDNFVYRYWITVRYERDGKYSGWDEEFFSLPAPAPENVQLTCKPSSIVISWEAGSTDVLEYRITFWYGPGSDAEPLWVVPGDATSYEMDNLLPGYDYYHGFMIRAITENGRSKRIWTTGDGCKMDPAPPFTNPKEVCAAKGAKDELVVVWEPITWEHLNGPEGDFYYKLSYKPEENAGPIPEPIYVWWGYGTYSYTIDGLTYGAAYVVTLESENAQGKATEGPAQEMLMHVGIAGCNEA